MTQVHARALTSTQFASGTACSKRSASASSETTWVYLHYATYLAAGIAPRNDVESTADAAVSAERHSREVAMDESCHFSQCATLSGQHATKRYHTLCALIAQGGHRIARAAMSRAQREL